MISIAEFLHLRRVLDLRVRKLADVEEEEAAEEEMAALNAEMGGAGGDGRHLDSRGNAAAKAPLLPGPSARRSAAKRGPGCVSHLACMCAVVHMVLTACWAAVRVQVYEALCPVVALCCHCQHCHPWNCGHCFAVERCQPSMVSHSLSQCAMPLHPHQAPHALATAGL